MFVLEEHTSARIRGRCGCVGAGRTPFLFAGLGACCCFGVLPAPTRVALGKPRLAGDPRGRFLRGHSTPPQPRPVDVGRAWPTSARAVRVFPLNPGLTECGQPNPHVVRRENVRRCKVPGCTLVPCNLGKMRSISVKGGREPCHSSIASGPGSGMELWSVRPMESSVEPREPIVGLKESERDP